MAPRKATASNNTLSPLAVPESVAFPRANSPNSGLTNFFKPAKWFGRSASQPKVSSVYDQQPRSSTSSNSARKHKISRPTDPRPILDSYASSSGSKSVLDLSARAMASLDLQPPNQPASPSRPSFGGGGDLRNISRQAWSRSVDDLSNISSPRPALAPINTSFHEKIQQYRNRSGSNASAAPSSSPLAGNSFSVQHPFPTSGSPPRPSIGSSSPISISVSAPQVEVPSSSNPPADRSVSPVHIRSHSFTPKLSSKLGNARFGGPASPNRKGSWTPDQQQNDPLSSSEPKPGLRTPVWGNSAPPSSIPSISKPVPADPNLFSNPFHGAALASSPARPQTILLAPPATITSDNRQSSNLEILSNASKRSSQVVYHSGFVNRLAEPPTPSTLAASNTKAWKPFKMELKGSKLFLYKPPNDRFHAVRELFPATFIPPSMEDHDPDSMIVPPPSLQDEDASRGRKGSGGLSAGRRKRAYWGRATHPDLMRDGENNAVIEKGTFEALIHESVFRTTFVSSDNVNSSLTVDQAWQDFASAVILCLPFLVVTNGSGDRAKFETELLRCCEYLVSGATSDEEAEAMRDRVAWIAGVYLRSHGPPMDFDKWEEWRTGTIPNRSEADARIVASSPSGLPASTSTRAIFHPSPTISATSSAPPTPTPPGFVSGTEGIQSPNLATFSPRPDGSAGASLMDAFVPRTNGIRPSTSTSPRGDAMLHPGYRPPTSSTTPNSSTSAIPWAALEAEGLTRDFITNLDPSFVAQSLSKFQKNVMQSCPENITGEALFSDFEDNLHHCSAAINTHIGTPRSAIVSPMYTPGSSSGYQVVPPVPPLPQQQNQRPETSRTHTRSEAIAFWARVGEFCRMGGDECSWRAIQTALCSRPIARLEKAWKRVDESAIGLVEGWVYDNAEDEEGEGKGVVVEPRVSCWGGDGRAKAGELMKKAAGFPGLDDAATCYAVPDLLAASRIFEVFRTRFLLCSRKIFEDDVEVAEEGDMGKMVEAWRVVAQGEQGGLGTARRFQRIEQFMSLSLVAEPKRRGIYEPHWSRSATTQPSHSSLLPLLFPEPLVSSGLIDRDQLLKGGEVDVLNVKFGKGPDGRLVLQLQEDERKSLRHLNLAYNENGGLSTGSRCASGVDSTSSSRPPSSVIEHSSSDGKVAGSNGVGRTPSIRVKPGSSQSLERKASVAKRSSLPALSRPLQNALMITELNSDSPPLRVVADDMGEVGLKTRELVLDKREFSKVWWNVFRSYVTPLVFFELLRKLYIRAQPRGSPPLPDDYISAASTRSEVLDTMREWIVVGGGAQDLLDDHDLHTSVFAFLENPTDHQIQEQTTFQDPSVQQIWSSLHSSRMSLNATIIAQVSRPSRRQDRMGAPPRSPTSSTQRPKVHGQREAPDIDHITPEDLVDNLDALAAAAFSNVTEEDLFVTADLFEVQCADRTGWLPSRDTSSHPRSISELGQDSLYRVLPPGIRSCIRAYNIVRKWLISRIVTPGLGLRCRQNRMELLLRTLEISRIRSLDSLTGGNSIRIGEQPCIRSFVESVVGSAIISVESRLHAKAWGNIAAIRGASPDSVILMLSQPRSSPYLTLLNQPLLKANGLVNFHKRRQLCNLISNAVTSSSPRKRGSADVHRRAFERLNNIEREMLMITFDIRTIKDEAQREASQASVGAPSSTRKTVRPFQRLISHQNEKNRRDKHLRGRLQKEKLQEQSKYEKREDALNRAMQPRRQKDPSLQKLHRSKKSMSSLFGFMRPISSAFVGDTASAFPLGIRRSASELDFPTTGKPTFMINLVDAHVSQFINTERNYVFRLDSEDGGHYLMQTTNKAEMRKWIETIDKISNQVKKRRLTYLGDSPQPLVSDHLHDGRGKPGSQTLGAVFGIELEVLLSRQVQSDQIPRGTIPAVIEHCLVEIENRGLTEVGIYRIAGAVSEINSLKDAFNHGGSPLNQFTDIHAVCDVVKSWLRVLPDPVFPSSLYHEAIEIMKIEDPESRLTGIPEHLDRVTDFEEANQMTAEALAIVFSPNLLRAPHNDFAVIMANMGHMHKLVKTFITHFHVIFDDNQEGDGDLEEDEIEEEEDLRRR
ncbi:rho GTPase activating protein 22 [Flagelloscypha sp. PMI_526]|nr:rho GTPase activating protein 22 [Flagelloscypha sp. PMI_526]